MKLYIPALLIFVLTTLAPAQSEAVEVTRYMAPVGGVNAVEIRSKIELLVKRLSQEPDAVRGAVVYANGVKWKGNCIDGNLVEDETLGKTLSKLIPKYLRGRIALIPGDTSAISAAWFYLIPVGASMPKRIGGNSELPCCCPSITVEGPAMISAEIRRVRYKLRLSHMSKKRPPNPEWNVSVGKIISGQGTMMIDVEVDNSAFNVQTKVTITPPNYCGCPTVASLTTDIVKKPK